MDHTSRLDLLQDECSRFIAVVDGAHLDVPVGTCPGWTLYDLAQHVGWAHRWIRRIVVEGTPVDWAEVAQPPPPGQDRLVSWLAGGSASLIRALGVDPSTPTWSWAPLGCVGWWARRVLHETAVHRADAEMAIGVPTLTGPEGAADGIEEILALRQFVARMGRGPVGAARGDDVYALNATDSPDSWLVRSSDQGFEVGGRSHRATASLNASASDLLLLLWNRLAIGRPELRSTGDAALLDRWLRSIRL